MTLIHEEMYMEQMLFIKDVVNQSQKVKISQQSCCSSLFNKTLARTVLSPFLFPPIFREGDNF